MHNRTPNPVFLLALAGHLDSLLKQTHDGKTVKKGGVLRLFAAMGGKEGDEDFPYQLSFIAQAVVNHLLHELKIPCLGEDVTDMSFCDAVRLHSAAVEFLQLCPAE